LHDCGRNNNSRILVIKKKNDMIWQHRIEW
jgi:hypothetical protein